MSRTVSFAVLFIAALASAQPKPDEIRALVAKLGSEDFADREAAGKRLDAIGAPAIDALRAALRSDNAEVVQRARTILRKIERRADNEKTLAPTLVELDAKEERLDDVLADLSKQAGWDVVLGGLKLDEVADRKVTIATGGKAPFWAAVLKICDAADVKIASSGLYLAPDAMPYHGRAPRGVRVTRNTQQSVILEDRGSSPRRPAAVFGAVGVEAVPFPSDAKPAAHSVLLQAWPEPRLKWQSMSGATFLTATDAAGARLTPETIQVSGLPTVSTPHSEFVVVRNPDGSATLVRDPSARRGPNDFGPNVRQVIGQFKSERPDAKIAKGIDVTLLAKVRTGVEPLTIVQSLEANAPRTGTGLGGAELTVRYSKNEQGRLVASVTVAYERGLVEPAGVGTELPGQKAGAAGFGNHTVHGVRITDADGKPFTLGLVGGASQIHRTPGIEVMALSLELHPHKDGNGPPKTATFWGTYNKSIEVPVVLKDVPLGPAK